MGSVRRRRVEQLEARLLPPMAPRPEATPQDAKQRWLDRAKMRRSEATHSPYEGWLQEHHARDLIRLFRMQGNLPDTTEELRGRLLAWRPPVDARAVERVLARSIYEHEEGTEGMECPPEWAEAFEAAEDLLGRYMEAPPEDLAQIFVAAHQLQEGDTEAAELEALEAYCATERERLGLTEELVRLSVGPDSDEIEREEGERRLKEVLADFYYGEKGYEVQQHIYRLMDEQRSV